MRGGPAIRAGGEYPLNDLYSQIDFIVSGGAVKLLTDFLSSRVSSALILEPEGEELQVLDAVRTTPGSLMMREGNFHIASLFSQHPTAAPFEVEQAEGGEEWPWIVRMRGEHWEIYILLKEKADDDLLSELYPYAGLIRLWRMHQRIDLVEKKLSRLSYMILATKNTLASIFEPMPLHYYAAFISDVLRESLFPRSIDIFRDDGTQLSLLAGKSDQTPERKGVYAEPILTPAPVLTQSGASYEVVLPIAEGSCRLFCVMCWDYPPDPQMLNFLELLGSLAVRALSISSLRTQNQLASSRVSLGDFTVLSLSNVLKALKQEKDRGRFLSLAADIFMEQGRMSDCLLAVWDSAAQGYRPVEQRRDGLKAPADAAVLSLSAPIPADRIPEASFDLRGEGTGAAPRAWGGCEFPWGEMSSMDYIFPICDDAVLLGFIALASKEHAFLDKSQLAALDIVSQFVAYEFHKFQREERG